MDNEHNYNENNYNINGETAGEAVLTAEERRIVRRNKIIKEIISWLVFIAVAWLLSLLVRHVIIVNAIVPSGSMRPTVEENTRLIAFRLSYTFSEPQRNHVVVAVSPNDGVTLYLKRIVGLPGETIEVINGRVYINGASEPLTEDFILETPHPRNDVPLTLIPEGMFFVMGDNRNDSSDSRNWRDPFLPRENVVGRAIFTYFPFSRIGLIR